MQFTSSCKLHLLPLYTHIFIRTKQCTFRKLIRFFVIMISCMRCDFAERYLYLLCSFLHMCRILAGKRCLGPPHACHPFFHTFVIIADLYCRILMLFRPLHCKGSPIYTEQEKYVQRDISEQLDSYELTDVSYSDENNCVISTRETYYVQVSGEALQLMTQECKYSLVKENGNWFMTSFVDINVVSRIKQ